MVPGNLVCGSACCLLPVAVPVYVQERARY